MILLYSRNEHTTELFDVCGHHDILIVVACQHVEKKWVEGDQNKGALYSATYT